MISARSLLFLFTVALFNPTAHALAFNVFGGVTAHPALQDLAKAQTDCKLSIRFDIGKKPKNRNDQPPHLFLDGLELELLQEQARSGMELPGASGHFPNSSSGARAVQVTQHPYFIGMGGKQTVEMKNAGWEMVWRDEKRCGSIVCGMDVLEKVRLLDCFVLSRRNECWLPILNVISTLPYLFVPIGETDYPQQRRSTSCWSRLPCLSRLDPGAPSRAPGPKG
jgi:hypothetical protein